MAKIKTITDINLRTPTQVVIVEKDKYMEVSEEIAIYFCREDIEALSLDKQKENRRPKHSIRTPIDEQNNPHEDYKDIK